MKSQRHVREFCDWLEGQGITVLSTEMGGKHPRINFRYGSREQFYVIPNSPSDGRRWLVNAQGDIRRLLNLPGRAKSVRPKRRHHARHEAAAPEPICLTVSDDPMAVLADHPSMPRVRALRIDRAWRAFWRACCEAVGHRSVLE